MPLMAILTWRYLYHHGVAIAWAGGAAFLASLIYLSYFYVATLARADGNPADVGRHAALNVALFSAFALHHSLLARSGPKQVVARWVGDRYERAAYVWVASGLVVAMCALWQPIPGLLYDIDGWWRLPFWAAQVLGALIGISAVRAIDPLDLSGIRQASGQPAAGALKVVGPFRFVRHPLYLGWMLVVLASPLMTANRLLFAAVSSLYLILAIPWEESSLVEAHGARYRDYQRLVRWRVIPGLW